MTLVILDQLLMLWVLTVIVFIVRLGSIKDLLHVTKAIQMIVSVTSIILD